MICCQCHAQRNVTESAQEICYKMSSQAYSLAMHFRNIVMSYAFINYGRIVIPIGLITFELYTDGEYE
jgi:hypothetical protein